jgi:hypothetical protein
MVLLICSILSPLFPLMYGWRKRFSILWWYAFASLSTDLITSLFKRVLHRNFEWQGNVFALIEFTLIAFYYRRKILKSNNQFYIFWTTGLVFFLAYTSFSHHWFSFNGLAISVLLLSYMSLGILGFYTLIKEQKTMFIEQSSFFWANVAIFIYASGTFFLFLLADRLKKNDMNSLMLLWSTVFLSLNILKNGLLGIALSKKTIR